MSFTISDVDFGPNRTITAINGVNTQLINNAGANINMISNNLTHNNFIIPTVEILTFIVNGTTTLTQTYTSLRTLVSCNIMYETGVNTNTFLCEFDTGSAASLVVTVNRTLRTVAISSIPTTGADLNRRIIARLEFI